MLKEKLSQIHSPDFCLAKQVCLRLKQEGYVAYLAGGAVRDFLMDRQASDYDVATNAEPDVVEGLFEKTLAVGKAFGCIVVVDRDTQVEVTSFRADGKYINGRQPETIIFSDAKTDALRRDFTINGMFLDLGTCEIIDFVGGEIDLQRGIIRAIGAPKDRFQEDHLRMLRAVRFQAQLGFEIELNTERALQELRGLVFDVSGERVYQEFCKILTGEFVEFALETLSKNEMLEKALHIKSQISWNYIRKIKKIQTPEGLFAPWFRFLIGVFQAQPDLIFIATLMEDWRFPRNLKTSLQKALRIFESYPEICRYRAGEILEMSFAPEIRYVFECLGVLSISSEFSDTWDRVKAHPSFLLKERPSPLVRAVDLKAQFAGEKLGKALRHSYFLQLENPSWEVGELLKQVGKEF